MNYFYFYRLRYFWLLLAGLNIYFLTDDIISQNSVAIVISLIAVGSSLLLAYISFQIRKN